MFKAAPLSSTFMVVSILAFLSSFIYFDVLGNTWGLNFMIFFALTFIASVISATHATNEDDLAIHTKKHKR